MPPSDKFSIMLPSAVRLLLIFAVFHTNLQLCFAENEEVQSRESGSCTEGCVRNILRKVFLKNEPLGSSLDTVELKFSIPRLQYEKLVEYVSVDNSWTSGESVIEELAAVSSIVQDEEDLGHIYQEGLSPKILIILCTGGFALATFWTILHGESRSLAAVLIMTLAFFCGLGWNWWKSYTEEFHRRVHLLPPECKPESSSWFHSFKGFIIDPNCNEYFKTPVDDPLAMVAPGTILEATFSMLFIKPIYLCFSLLTITVRSLTDHLVWPLNWILQACLSLMVVWAVVVAILILLASTFNKEFTFSLGLISGTIHKSDYTRSNNTGNPQRKIKSKNNSSVLNSLCLRLDN